ncbi:hypothetical protein GDO81_005272 [Engystomops pustulosus]|uniref:Uncharacterized protein n=1 Tax=Engystomops pustulosus TaxID=76066 RepID=A0AAV7CM57_ENGPU|nr:hypothetical protein GDO81_005272 [Engystomops pustulosus]
MGLIFFKEKTMEKHCDKRKRTRKSKIDINFLGQNVTLQTEKVAAGTIQLFYNENMRWLPLHSPALMKTVGGKHYISLMKTGNDWQ